MWCKFSLIVAAAPFVLTGCGTSERPAAPEVVVTIEPLAMILAELVGDSAQVAALVPPGASPHTYALRPSGARMAASSSALFYVDDHLDGWVAGVSAPRKFAVFESLPESLRKRRGNGTADGDGHHAYNPHFWTDPLTVLELVPFLIAALDEVDPEGRWIYESKRDQFVFDLVRLDDEVEALLEPLKGVAVIVHHPSWRYFLDRYGIETAAILEPSPGKEPTPRYLKEVIDTARAKGVQLIISEPQLSSRPAEVVAEAAGLKIVELDPIGGAAGRKTYGDWLLENARKLRGAVQ